MSSEKWNEMLSRVKKAAAHLANADTAQKNKALTLITKALVDRAKEILAANEKDVAAAKEAGKTAALVDRLTLTSERIKGVSDAVMQIVALEDPVGEIYDSSRRPNGLRVARMRMPLGVIGIIFESRPNVVIDAGVLCLKSGNGAVLRGGSEAQHSNNILGQIMRDAIAESGLPADCIWVPKDTDRDLVLHLLKAREHLDLVIPRGGEGLIRFVHKNAAVPTILHFKGVCHAYVDVDADFDKALPIVLNAKVQRPGVCNALETLLVHKDIATEFLPLVADALKEKGVEIRACEQSRLIVPEMTPAIKEDWDTEYLDLILAVKVVDDVGDALKHIAIHSSGHTETIITENYTRAGKFLRQAASSCVVVNASTRFNDGGELGLGAEIGISTTKLHAFGPMGLRELTTSKFIVLGDGQIRQ